MSVTPALGLFQYDDLQNIPKEIHQVFLKLVNKQIVKSKQQDVLVIELDHNTLAQISAQIHANIIISAKNII